jgi:hypothetical protein
MTRDEDPEAIAKLFIDSNLYMTLGTADADGRPWVSPVYYAVADYTRQPAPDPGQPADLIRAVSDRRESVLRPPAGRCH